MPATSSLPLVEREAEIAAIEAAIDDAAGGQGRLIVVEGAAGIGKSRLLTEVAARGQGRGFAVLTATGGEFERELGFGIVRQLFEPVVRRASQAERDALLAGAASLARPLLLPEHHSEAPPAEPGAVLHGLYWLISNLGDDRPLIVSVDDAQWCDAASAGWLLYLGRRLGDLPVLLVVAIRFDDELAGLPALDALTDLEAGTLLELAPLSERASGQLVGSRLEGVAGEALGLACFEATGGNPFLLTELIHELPAGASDDGAMERLRSLTPRKVSRAVVARLARLPEEARAVACALAVLGGRADVRELFALVDFDRAVGTTALDVLERAQIAGGRPLCFVHPLVGAAVHAEIPAARRSLDHARAARVLDALGADVGRIAGHLIQTEPGGDPWVVTMLRRAAGTAIGAGDPAAAARALGRAVREPPSPSDYPSVLHELGVAELAAGLGGKASEAERHLSDAVAHERDPVAAARFALDLGDAIWARHGYAEAVEVFDDAVRTLGGADPELALRIEAHAAAAGRLELGTSEAATRRLARVGESRPSTPSARLLAGVMAIDSCLAGAPARAVADLAEEMFDNGHLPSGQIGAQIPLFSINALLWADRLERAKELLDELVEAASTSGSVRGVILGRCWRGVVAQRLGSLGEAAGDLATAVELAAEHAPGSAVTHAFFADVLLDRGDVEGAAEALEPAALPDPLPDYIGWNFVLFTRGRLRATTGDLQGALEDFVACGDRQQRWGAPNPAVIPWRTQAALTFREIGDRERGRALAREELRLARRFGAPRAIGISLHTMGAISEGERGISRLREAVQMLAGTSARLERARALISLGGALRRANQRAAAREPLREGLELAVRCGASGLAGRARRELLATGARPRHVIRTGVDALTPVERQTASLAAEGLGNPAIAQALFISRKTVEKRLSEAFRKLGIRSRSELAAILAPGDAAQLGQSPAPQRANVSGG